MESIDKDFERLTIDHRLKPEINLTGFRSSLWKNPDTNAFWVRVITVPGHMFITGDLGDFTLCRPGTKDMLCWFGTNDHYVAEKVTTGEAYVWCPKTAKESVRELIAGIKNQTYECEDLDLESDYDFHEVFSFIGHTGSFNSQYNRQRFYELVGEVDHNLLEDIGPCMTLSPKFIWYCKAVRKIREEVMKWEF